mmetsp:Transcript_16906/g.14828  ORF Transcript_16906/g.14828 Transcript_16906/m.14828 type:complete len:124 (+) Transcript_16906:1364-1735(+)
MRKKNFDSLEEAENDLFTDKRSPFLNQVKVFKTKMRTDDTKIKRTARISLNVSDTGLGIPKVEQSSLFKLFGKIKSHQDRNQTGCGLGLTICKKIIEKLGGNISLESRENVGTKVTCIFLAEY